MATAMRHGQGGTGIVIAGTGIVILRPSRRGPWPLLRMSIAALRAVRLRMTGASLAIFGAKVGLLSPLEKRIEEGVGGVVVLAATPSLPSPPWRAGGGES